MKALKILTYLCLILVFSTNNAISQAHKEIKGFHQEFSPTEVPCLTETVSGEVFESYFFSNFTYHAKGQGTVKGESTDEVYTVEYEFNSVGLPIGNERIDCFTFPMLLKHDGKLVAVIHRYEIIVYNANGVLVVNNTGISRVECK